MKSIKDLYDEHGFFSLIFEKMEEWEWYTDLPCFKLMVHLIIKSMKKDTSYRGEPVLRGQYRTSRARLAMETGLSEKQVRTALKKLEKTKEIIWAKSRAKQRSIITLCNFEKYQPELLERGQGKGQAGAKLGPSNKEELSVTSSKDKNKEDVFSVRPEFVSEEDWKALILHRRGHKQKPKETEYAYKILAGKIKKTMELGFTSTEVIEQIVVRNWQSVEPSWMPENKSTKGGNNGRLTRAQANADKRHSAARTLLKLQQQRAEMDDAGGDAKVGGLLQGPGD